MTEEIANLILENGEDIFPYLKMRAEHLKGAEIVPQKYSRQDIENLELSGYIKVEDGKIILEEKGSWVYSPNLPKKEFNRSKKYVPEKLLDLGEICGYPPDWQNSGKYVKLFNDLLKEFEYETLHEVALWMKTNKPELTLQSLLTRSWFKELKHSKDYPKEAKFIDRVAKETYREDDEF